MLVASFISTVLGMYLPGPGTIYLKQELEFKRPVKYNETITARVEVMELLDEQKHVYKLKTIIFNQNEEVVVQGYAVVKYDE